MTRKITKSAAAERIHKLAAVARVVQRTKSAGCCGRKPSSKRKRRSFKRSSLNKEASRDFIRKVACAVSVIQRTRGLQKAAAGSWLTNPIAIGAGGGGILGGALGLALGPKGQKFLSGLAGLGLGTGIGAGAGYGYTKLTGAKKEETKPESQVTVTATTPPANEGKQNGAKKQKNEKKEKKVPLAATPEVAPATSGVYGPPLSAANIPVIPVPPPQLTSDGARELAASEDSIRLPDEWLDKFNELKTVQGRIDLLRGLYKDMAPVDVMKYANNPDLFNEDKPMIDLGRYTKNSGGAY